MAIQHDRLIGGAFSPTEEQLLDLLCSGEDPQFAHARAQRAIATWGGYEYDECGCFLILVPQETEIPAIEHFGGPFAAAEVSDGTETLGHLDLWVVDGRLHSINYMPFGDDHTALPTSDEYEITLIEDD